MTKTKRIRRLKATIKSHAARVNAWATLAEGLIQDNTRLYARCVEAEDRLNVALEACYQLKQEARSPKQKLASAVSEIITNSREAGK